MTTTRALTANLEDYWLRMGLAEQKLCDKWDQWLDYQPAKARLCLSKASVLADRYHEHWTMSKREYYG